MGRRRCALDGASHVHWCDGTEAENAKLIETMLASGTLSQLNRETHPDCYLHRSDASDVARVEHLTFVCTRERDDAGPNNHWMAPDEAHARMDALFAGCMRGQRSTSFPTAWARRLAARTLRGGDHDSGVRGRHMRLMTRMGRAALARIERDGEFVKGLHSTAIWIRSAASSCTSRKS